MAYRACLFGNGTFDRDATLAPLKGPRNDIEWLRHGLTHETLGIHHADHVHTYLDRTHSEMRELMEDFFASAGHEDQLLLYYSGHGKRDGSNNLFLCARDTRSDRLQSTAVADTSINGMIDNSFARAVIIVLDCCHAGAFKSAGDIPENLKGKGRFVLASCRGAQPAEDAKDPTENSVFTHYMVESLLSENVDENGDGFISLNEIYNHLLKRVREVSKMVPQRHFDNTVGDVIVAKARPKDPDRTGFPETGIQRPILDLSETRIEVHDVALGEELPRELIDVINRGGGELHWEVTSADDWVVVLPYEVKNGYFELELRPPTPGINRARVHVRSKEGGSKRISITAYVADQIEAPQLDVDPRSLSFGELVVGGASTTRSILLRNLGGGELNAKVSSRNPLVRAHVVRGRMVEVSITPEGATAIEDEIEIRSDGGTVVVPVSATIVEGAVLRTKPANRLDFGRLEGEGSNRSMTLEIFNDGTGKLSWQAERDSDFFTMRRSGESVVVRLVDDIQPGAYHGKIVITSNGGDRTIDVRASIKERQQPRGKLANAATQAPANPWPGNWRVMINVYGLVGSQMVVNLAANGALSGQQNALGIQMTVQGGWAFDGVHNILVLQYGGVAFGIASGAETIHIQIQQATQTGFVGVDMAGRQYTFDRC